MAFERGNRVYRQISCCRKSLTQMKAKRKPSVKGAKTPDENAIVHEIKVQQKHIENGNRSEAYTCPISLAIREYLTPDLEAHETERLKAGYVATLVSSIRVTEPDANQPDGVALCDYDP